MRRSRRKRRRRQREREGELGTGETSSEGCSRGRAYYHSNGFACRRRCWRRVTARSRRSVYQRAHKQTPYYSLVLSTYYAICQLYKIFENRLKPIRANSSQRKLRKNKFLNFFSSAPKSVRYELIFRLSRPSPFLLIGWSKLPLFLAFQSRSAPRYWALLIALYTNDCTIFFRYLVHDQILMCKTI